MRQGFTLIELSIVLVIIGLIVGGVLAGQDLIRAAAVRAQISQIEKYNAAVNTFRGKYGYLPGDIKDPEAANFGFAPRGGYPGEGDGNGVIEGVSANGPGANLGTYEFMGETLLFWEDLSKVGLVEESFATGGAYGYTYPNITSTSASAFFPSAKIGNGNSILVYSANAINYFNLAIVGTIGTVQTYTGLGITPSQAQSIDRKLDDGFPQTGNVQALWLVPGGSGIEWAGNAAYGTGGASDTSATQGTATTCFDNANIGGVTQTYSLLSAVHLPNCALTFRFQ